MPAAVSAPPRTVDQPPTRAAATIRAREAQCERGHRTYRCDACDLVLDRDLNAAINLAVAA